MYVRINLDRLLKERSMNQRELSIKTGIRAASIHEMYYNQTQRLPLKNIALICETLDCEIQDLLTLQKDVTNHGISGTSDYDSTKTRE